MHKLILTAVGCMICLMLTACEKKSVSATGAPPPTQVIHVSDSNVVAVDHPEQFPLVASVPYEAASDLNVTGTVNPDVDKMLPVISLASGRVVDIRVRLGDTVKKGQLLMRVQSNDVAGAFDTYLKSVNDERLAATQLKRAELLYQHGAIPQSQLEQAQNTEQDAATDLKAAEQQLQTLGIDKNHPSNIVNVYAPISGVVVTQNVTDAAAAGVTYSGSSTAFTIANLSDVWVICNVYENDIPSIHLGQKADIHFNAYPDKVLTGTISNISPILDPNLRTAQVRLQVHNPGFMNIGMFVTANFHGKHLEQRAAIPADAILHLHDRDWVFIPAGANHFQRVEVTVGKMLPKDQQEIVSGVSVGQQVVSNALSLNSTVEQ
ncbi:efflux RND transporter periplasmic adaptor subunit [Edaphobacter dinghuensis]|uniref:Hemolysin D n=1 Tax=Edaphobacter dinghuensis TaxID=1560005 RepID=A0A917HA88_9BACT|nr:efflux RND transporter periplasmic adaptor subunit [Edaphobacter dinghuensis]GGG72087.1 hemolysin D [Edaphobacter dinghuensis]